MSTQKPHTKDIGRKPATVVLNTDTDGMTKTINADHAEPKDGYLYVKRGNETAIYPWHRVHEVTRDA